LIDLHSHILHAVDDGARTLADAVAMARASVAQGVTIMAATPHGHSSASAWAGYSVVKLYDRIEELRAALRAERIALELVPGTEIFGEPGAVERLRRGELLPYGESRAVLVEFPLGIAQAAAEQVVVAFQLAGHRVVIAHPERYRFVQDDPNSLSPMVERGALMQLTGDALVGNQGERMRHLAETMLTHGLVQIIASDAHGPHHNRLPNMGQARERAIELIGADATDLLTQQIPAAVLSDGPLTPTTPQKVQRWGGMR
jgi:protein-tyrosine phosphatase